MRANQNNFFKICDCHFVEIIFIVYFDIARTQYKMRNIKMEFHKNATQGYIFEFLG